MLRGALVIGFLFCGWAAPAGAQDGTSRPAPPDTAVASAARLAPAPLPPTLAPVRSTRASPLPTPSGKERAARAGLPGPASHVPDSDRSGNEPAAAADPGDPRLMLAGGTLGAAIGYLVGWGAAAGVVSTIETRGADADRYVDALAVLPSLASAVGAATGAGKLSCTRLRFGAFYPLNSCADAWLAFLGAVPGAVLQYFAPAGRPGAVAGAVLLEAAGAALAGTLARRHRHPTPAW